MIFMLGLWLLGWWLRPDFWAGLDNSFNLLLAFTEIGLMGRLSRRMWRRAGFL